MSARDDLDDFVANLVRIGADQLAQALGTPTDAGMTIMRKVAEELCVAYARRAIYVTVAYDPRNREIVAKFGRQGPTARAYTGARIRELAAEYELTPRRIYDIVRDAREADLASRQSVLPGLDDPDQPA